MKFLRLPSRRRLKRTGLVVTALALGMWTVSLLWVAGYSQPIQSDTRFQWSAFLINGCLTLNRADWGSRGMSGFVTSGRMPKTGWILHPREGAMEWPPRLDLPRSGYAYAGATLPLWVPFLLFGAPTAWLWWRDSRPRGGAGQCPKCRYNLTGLEGVVACPECGFTTPPATPSAPSA